MMDADDIIEIVAKIFGTIVDSIFGTIIKRLPVIGSDPIDGKILVYVAAFIGVYFFTFWLKKKRS